MNSMNGNGNGNGHTNGFTPPTILAGFVCLFSFPMIYLATRPVAWLFHAQWIHWLLVPLFILFPASVAYIILYRSPWHREWPGSKRIPSLILASALIFCVALFIAGLVFAIACLLTDFSRMSVRGE